jgi:hypothetical protein
MALELHTVEEQLPHQQVLQTRVAVVVVMAEQPFKIAVVLE